MQQQQKTDPHYCTTAPPAADLIQFPINNLSIKRDLAAVPAARLENLA